MMNSEDVTQQRLDEVWSWTGKILPAPKMSATEAALLARIPEATDIGFWSKSLSYSPVIRHLCYNKPEHTALVKLLKRGALKILREYGPDRETLVKVS